MSGEKLWDEIEDFLYDYDDGKNFCETYIDVKYSKKAITSFLEEKIKKLRRKNEYQEYETHSSQSTQGRKERQKKC